MKYIKQLDGLRAFAVLVVLVQHWIPIKKMFNVVIPFGAFGVELFFVLSGFLISSILMGAKEKVELEGKSRTNTVKAFYGRRFLRIFPIYYITLFVLLILGHPEIRNYFFWHFFYASNVNFAVQEITNPGVHIQNVRHLWTLAVEEQFYLFWPWVILLTKQKNLWRVLLGFLLVGPLWRIGTYLLDWPHAAITTQVFANLDTFVSGAILAYLFRYRPETLDKLVKSRIPLIVGLVLSVGLLIYINMLGRDESGILTQTPSQLRDPLWYIFLKPGFALTYFWLIAKTTQGFTGFGKWLLENPVTIYLGRISYGIYLYHNVLPYIIKQAQKFVHFPFPDRQTQGALWFMTMFVITIAVCSLSWYLFEKPINRFKNRFQYVK